MRTAKSRFVESPKPLINLTPLIDVLLVLLIIFMVIAPPRATLPVRAPERVTSDPPTSEDETLILRMLNDDTVSLNNRKVSLGDLPGLLSDRMQRRLIDERTLFIRAPNVARYDSVFFLIDLARGAGCSNIGLLSDD